MGIEMDKFEKCTKVLEELFGRDYQFALATSEGNVPAVRFVDTFYDNQAFYIVTYAKSRKVNEIEKNSHVALCNKLYRFDGTAYNMGHPLEERNSEIRAKLIKAFEPWYFKHNNENDENMCYVKIEPGKGFFYKDGTGYNVDFTAKTVEEFPFDFDIFVIN